MDVRVGDWVATPRHGKPVEINALWYNALCVTAELAEHFKEDSSVYRQLATRVSASFRKEFWNEKDGCLYDVIEENGKDASIRPNQIYAVSLPHTMLTAKQALQVVNTVEEKLLGRSRHTLPLSGTQRLSRDLLWLSSEKRCRLPSGNRMGISDGRLSDRLHESPPPLSGSKKTGNGISCTGTDPPFGRGLHWFYFRNF